MALFDTRADWDKYYAFLGERWGCPAFRQPVMLHYNDYTVGGEQRARGQNLMQRHNISANMQVVVVGAGFGWTIEGMVAQGVRAVGTDISSWIQANKDTTEEGDLVDYCQQAGINFYTDKVIGPPDHPNAVLEVPAYKQAAWDNWIVSPKADKRRAHVEWWQSLSEDGKRAERANLQDPVYDPKMPTGPKPEYMVSPADLWLTRQTKRTDAAVIAEDGSSVPSLRAIANQIGGSVDVVFTEELLNSVTDQQALIICEYIQNLLNRHGNSGAKIVHILSPLVEGARQDPELNWKTFADWRALLDANGFSSHAIQDGRGGDGVYVAGDY